MGRIPPDPGGFRKSGKQRGCGIRNLEECTENQSVGMFESLQVGNGVPPPLHLFHNELTRQGLGGGGRQKNRGVRTYRDGERDGTVRRGGDRS
jgi:hypothetical protein